MALKKKNADWLFTVESVIETGLEAIWPWDAVESNSKETLAIG